MRPNMLAWCLRFVALLALVVLTWNPDGRSFVHWVTDLEDGITATKAFVAVVFTIAWVVAFVSSWKSLGVIPTGLLAALVGTGLWALADWTGATISARGISYLVLVAIAFVLATAISWREARGALSRRFRGSEEDAA